jgi:transposase InsO family protein
LIACGAKTNIINRKNYFVRYDDELKAANHVMILADGTKKSGDAEMRGDVKVTFTDSTGKDRDVVLSNVLYMPSCPMNIISVNAVVKKGCRLMLNKDKPSLIMNDGTQFSLMLFDRLYYLPFSDPMNVDVANTSRNLDLYDWHVIFGHCNQKDVLRNASNVDGMEINSKSMPDCEICIVNKKPNERNRDAVPKSNNVFDLVYSDLSGPITPVGKQGFKYVMNFVDDHSGAIFLYPLKRKSDAVKCLKLFLADSKKYGAVKALRSDNGTEYVNKEFQDVLLDNGIEHQTSAPYSPHQNGRAERSWRSLFEMARCMLNENGLPKSLWPYALLHASYIRNRCPCAWSKTETPYSIITGSKPDVGDLEPFGKSCFAYDHTVSGKLEKRWKKGIFCGFDRRSPALFVYHAETQNVVRHRNVKFVKPQPKLQNVSCDNDFDDDDDDDDDVRWMNLHSTCTHVPQTCT